MHKFYKLHNWIPIYNLDWNCLSMNSNAINILEKNVDKINWGCLSLNENAISILEANQDKINWEYLCENPSIFTYDYCAMKNHMKNSGIAEELMKNRFHPKYQYKWKNDWGFDDTLDDEDFK